MVVQSNDRHSRFCDVLNLGTGACGIVFAVNERQKFSSIALFNNHIY